MGYRDRKVGLVELALRKFEEIWTTPELRAKWFKRIWFASLAYLAIGYFAIIYYLFK